MGSGVCVRVYVVDSTLQYLNVYVDGIAEDPPNDVQGLCAEAGFDPTSHVITNPDTWKVPTEDSLFESPIAEQAQDYDLPDLCRCTIHGGQDVECGSATAPNTGEDKNCRRCLRGFFVSFCVHMLQAFFQHTATKT